MEAQQSEKVMPATKDSHYDRVLQSGIAGVAATMISVVERAPRARVLQQQRAAVTFVPSVFRSMRAHMLQQQRCAKIKILNQDGNK